MRGRSGGCLQKIVKTSIKFKGTTRLMAARCLSFSTSVELRNLLRGGGRGFCVSHEVFSERYFFIGPVNIVEHALQLFAGAPNPLSRPVFVAYVIWPHPLLKVLKHRYRSPQLALKAL